MIENLTVGEACIILHASGLLSGTNQYRDHYCTYPSNTKLLKLVGDGYFQGPNSTPGSDMKTAMFFLTQKGITSAMDLAERFNSFKCNCVGKDEEE